MSQRTQGLRLDFGRRGGLTTQPAGQELEGWLGNLGQLRAPTALDRTIVDALHQSVTQDPRSQPFLLWAVTLCCVVPVVMTFRADVPAPSSHLVGASSADSSGQRPLSPAASEPTQLATKVMPEEAPAHGQTTASKPLIARPLVTYHSPVRSALAPRVAMTRTANHTTPDVAAPLRLAAATPRPLAGTSFWPTPPSVVRVEVLPAAPLVAADVPVVPTVSTLSWSGADVATAPIRLHTRTGGMVSPAALLASVPAPRDGSHRPIYKRPWFLGVLGVAATGLAAGVTAAVVSAQQTPRGTAGYPLTISLGPT